jgi:hypothetical protein
MPKVIELQASRRRKGGVQAKSQELLFMVEGATLNSQVLDLILPMCPGSLDGLLREDDGISIECEEADIWTATVPYEAPSGGEEPKPPEQQPSVENDWTLVDFDGMGGSEQATQCIKQIEYGPNSARDIVDSRVVGLSKNGVEGYSRQVYKFGFTVNIQIPRLTIGHIKLLGDMVDATPVNNATFFGFPAGDVLFRGPRGRVSSNLRKPAELGLSFEVQRERKDIKIGNEITVPTKEGWQYLWIMYKQSVLNDRVVEVPDVAFVADIYEKGDFSKFNHLFNPNYV